MDNTRAYIESIFQGENSNLFLDISDGTLLTEDGYSFPIHKFVLARCSRYFSEIFCGIGKGEKDVLIPGIRGEVLSSILTYIYKEEICITEENVFDVMIASNNLSLLNLFSQTKIFLNKQLSVANCLAVHMTVLKMNCTDFLRDSYRFISTHFEELVYSTHENFYTLPLDLLMQLFNDRNLRVQNESVVWHAIVKWVGADLYNRLHRVPDLLMYLRIADINDNLAAEIMTHAMVVENQFCHPIYIRSTTNSRNVLEFRPRKPTSLNFISPYLYKNKYPDKAEIYVTYDENIDLWRKITEVHFWPNFLACMDNFVYAIDANDDYKMRYNIIEKELVEIRDFRIPRSGYAVVQLDGLLYILGGRSEAYSQELQANMDYLQTYVYDVEIYHPEVDAWYDAMPMLPVIFPSAVTLNGSIYVVGTETRGSRMIAQKYNPTTKLWMLLPDPPFTRCVRFTLVAYNDRLCVIGEKNADDNEKNVYVFHPLENVWHSIQNLPYAYCCPRALVINDQLIVSENPVCPEENPPVQWNNNEDCWEAITESSPMFNIQCHVFANQNLDDNLNVISKENKMPTTAFEKSPFS